MPNNFKSISLKKSKTSEITKNNHEIMPKKSEALEVKDARRTVEEKPLPQPSQASMTILPSKNIDNYSFALGKKIKEMTDNIIQKFSNIKKRSLKMKRKIIDY